MAAFLEELSRKSKTLRKRKAISAPSSVLRATSESPVSTHFFWLHDSAAYLDHINGKKQMKARGMSMRVERSTVDQVRAKFEAVKKRKAEEKANGGKAKAYEERLAIAEADEETMRARKKAKEQARKAKKRAEEEAALNELSAGVDPEMAAMMGFSGFGGGK